ncbi:MAG: hypothetical protein NXI00_23330 [Cytophagales bacterium]|nr:hypothetical protein [Cytophagales bacterium]
MPSLEQSSNNQAPQYHKDVVSSREQEARSAPSLPSYDFAPEYPNIYDGKGSESVFHTEVIQEELLPEISHKETANSEVAKQTEVARVDYKYKILLLHLFSITFAVLSLELSPLLELVPMIMFYVFAKDLKNQPKNLVWLHILDITVTAIVMVLFLAIIIALAVFTFGIGAVFLLLLIPYIVVLIQLFFSWPKNAEESESVEQVV